MAAQDFIVFISFSFLCLDSNAHSAYIISAAVRDQDVIEISKTDWAVILVNSSPLSIFISMFLRVFINKRDFMLLIIGLNSYFISIFKFLCISPIDFFHDPLLFFYFFPINLDTQTRAYHLMLILLLLISLLPFSGASGHP